MDGEEKRDKLLDEVNEIRENQKNIRTSKKMMENKNSTIQVLKELVQEKGLLASDSIILSISIMKSKDKWKIKFPSLDKLSQVLDPRSLLVHHILVSFGDS